MKKFWVGLALLSVVSVGAEAADLPVKARPAPAPVWSPSWTVYTLWDVGSFKSTFPGREFKSRGYQGTTGFTYTVTPNWSVGGGFIYSHSDNDLYYLNYANPGSSRSRGIAGFGTTAYAFPDHFTIGGAAGGGRLTADQTYIVPFGLLAGQRSTMSQDTEFWFASAYAAKQYQYGNWFLTPTARLVYKESRSEDAFDNLNQLFPSQRSTSFEIDYGGQLAYALPMGNGWTLFPTVEVYGLHFFDLPLYQGSRNGVDIVAGLSATSGNWSVGAAYHTIQGIDALHDYQGGRFFLSYRFGGPTVGTSGTPLGVSGGGSAVPTSYLRRFGN